MLRLASLLWRLRRATTMETGLFEIQLDHLAGLNQPREVIQGRAPFVGSPLQGRRQRVPSCRFLANARYW